MIEEMKRIDVTECFRQEEKPYDVVSLVRYPPSFAHLLYRWKENGIDHTLEIIVNSPTITVDDITASLYMENDDTGTVGETNKTYKA